MQFLLDTNICIYIIKRKPQKVFERFQSLNPSDIGISSITVAELEYGAYKSQRLEQNRAALNQFILPLEIVPFDEKSTQTYGNIRAELERKGIIIGAMDLLIASQAKALGLILVTNNVDEFSRIENLTIQNWTT
ncbi:type II toxin-antitoxin system VapC family toxin [Limnoraphis robusta Tam1]|uniref:type II toxin-antitoxin system tRNA(fMet)-specific endonuclease VapC n=1 Tax=Limnoraphis robusta TaxID=1118279 RepID=UPI002B20B239|nr:type II toxin-antitoxin system VapC family toxin [Limnoraphis robusta]MEA5496990.1 type II toxin-antitoxin system VapC family toxin [Limnoraphis robusta BA-68 BA1]MEA5541146.1 type II toxin-antitoxin system VapC family toxin [Limnoraphis robusta Tam1]